MAGPEKEFRIGGVKCTVWKNEFEGITSYKYSLTKTYKDKLGDWKETSQYSQNDLFKLRLVIDEALRDFAFKEKE